MSTFLNEREQNEEDTGPRPGPANPPALNEVGATPTPDASEGTFNSDAPNIFNDPYLRAADDLVDYELSEEDTKGHLPKDNTIRDRKNRLGRMPDTAFPIFQVCWAPEAQLAHDKSRCAVLAEELGYPLQSLLDEVADRRCNLLRAIQRIPSGPTPAAHELGY